MADLFKCLDALDSKDYDYYDRIDNEERRTLSPYILLMWISLLKNNGNISEYYVLSANNVNLHFLNENVNKHPKLQWLLLCSVSPGMGKQYRKWIPQLSKKFSNLEEPMKMKDAVEYLKKLDISDKEIAKELVVTQNREQYLASNFPHMKLADIKTLSKLITNEEIQAYERDKGM